MPREQYTRPMMAEDLIAKVAEAGNLASLISSDLNDGVNPPEMRKAWATLSADLVSIVHRASKLAR